LLVWQPAPRDALVAEGHGLRPPVVDAVRGLNVRGDGAVAVVADG
jgi:hypothetical protein